MSNLFVNEFTVCGRLCADPVLRTTASGICCCDIRIAVARDYRNADGTRDADFFTVKLWKRDAENVVRFLRRGDSLYISAALRNNSYVDRAGIRHYENDIVAECVRFVDSRKKDTGSFDTEEFFEAAVQAARNNT